MQFVSPAKLVVAVLGLGIGFAVSALEPMRGNTISQADFQRMHPCPSNGMRRGMCPGWAIKYLKPVSCGGADSAMNMKWERVSLANPGTRFQDPVCLTDEPKTRNQR